MCWCTSPLRRWPVTSCQDVSSVSSPFSDLVEQVGARWSSPVACGPLRFVRQTIATNAVVRPEESLLTKREIAAYLRVTPRTIEHMTRDGRLVCIRIGRTVRFHLGDVLEHLRKQ